MYFDESFGKIALVIFYLVYPNKERVDRVGESMCVSGVAFLGSGSGHINQLPLDLQAEQFFDSCLRGLRQRAPGALPNGHLMC